MAHGQDDSSGAESAETATQTETPKKRSGWQWLRRRKKSEDVAETRNNYPLF